MITARRIEDIIVDFMRRQGMPLVNPIGAWLLPTAEDAFDFDGSGRRLAPGPDLDIRSLAEEIATELGRVP